MPAIVTMFNSYDRPKCLWCATHNWNFGYNCYRIPGNFASLNFREKNFMKNIFANDPHVQYIRCGMAILLWNLILRLSKIRKIHENLVTRKLPGIWYLSEAFRALSSSFYPVDLHLLNGNFSMNITVLYAFITLHVL